MGRESINDLQIQIVIWKQGNKNMKAKLRKKIDLEKIDNIENLVNKSLKDKNLPQDTALQKAAEELGLWQRTIS